MTSSRHALLLALVALVPPVGCGDDGGGSSDSGPGGDSGGQRVDAGTGSPCGGFIGTTCDEGLYCDYGDNSCGNGDATGTCRAIPDTCLGAAPAPVCGCDGVVYDSECLAAMAGFDLSEAGGCKAPAGDFACGYAFCVLGEEYCEATQSIEGSPTIDACNPLPGSCPGNPGCACLADEPCGAMCTEATPDALILTCPPG